MQLLRFVLIAGLLQVLPGLAAADTPSSQEQLLACRFATPPTVPSGVNAAMRRAEKHVRRFIREMQRSLDCLNTVATMEAGTPAERARIVALHDNGVDQMHAIAAAFNRQLEIYRSRDPKGVNPEMVRERHDLSHN